MKLNSENIILFMTGLNFNLPLLSSMCAKLLFFLIVLSIPSACVEEDERIVTEEPDVVDPLIGAWGGQDIIKDQAVDVVVIFTSTHQVAAWFNASTGALVSTNGGLWSRTGIHVTEKVEFHSDRPERVGTYVSFDIELVNDSLSIVGSDSWLTRVDQRDQDRLEGVWQLKEEGATGASSADPKRIRMMSSTRFQEVEYEPESGRLLSTAGGRYQIDGVSYLEETIFSTSQEAVDVQAVPFTVEREAESWRQIGTNETERVWQRY